MSPAERRRDYRSGSVYQRKSDGLWIGTIEAGYTATGSRRRITVSGKTEAQAKRKLRDRQHALKQGETSGGRMTVKAWADTYLTMRLADLAPKAYNAAANPIRKWVVPTIGTRRLDQLTPADIRAVAEAQRRAGLKTTTAAATQRALKTMLRAAITEGHHVPANVLTVKAPKVEKSDRLGMTVPEGLAMLKAAADHPRGSRWLVTLLYGMRMGESLGLTWDAVDFDAGRSGRIIIEWQLQPLPYRTPGDRSSGFRLPDGYEARHLVDSYHLVRPKSQAGYRVAPLLPVVRDTLLRWRERSPANPWGLVWPEANGRPMNDKHDRAEWWALQKAAGVAHPEGRPYHVHECRNFAATMLLRAGVDPHIIKALLGHSSVVMSQKYMSVGDDMAYEAMERVGDLLQLG